MERINKNVDAALATVFYVVTDRPARQVAICQPCITEHITTGCDKTQPLVYLRKGQD